MPTQWLTASFLGSAPSEVQMAFSVGDRPARLHTPPREELLETPAWDLVSFAGADWGPGADGGLPGSATPLATPPTHAT